MDITFCCDKCGQNLEVEEAGAGMTVDCPKCGKPVYVPSGPKATEPSEPRVPGKPKATEPIKPRIAGKQGSPHAQRAEEVIREMEDAQELAKFIEKPHSRVVMTDIALPFWSVFVLTFKIWISLLILTIITWPIVFILSMKLAPRFAEFLLRHPSLLQ